MEAFIIPAILIGGLGGIFGIILAFASKKYYVQIDERVEKIIEVLPNANCGACGFAGCSNYADSIINNNTDPNLCTPGGIEVITKISKILNVNASEKNKQVAFFHCASGGYKNTLFKYKYQGLKSCQAVSLLANGQNACSKGCLSLNDCIKACLYGAIKLNNEGMRIVDTNKCVGCSLCVKACPRKLIDMVPCNKNVFIVCNSTDKGNIARKNCGNSTACIGCGVCARNCPVNAITIETNLAIINYSLCINCGICAIKCPTNAIIDTKEKRLKAKIAENDCIGCKICAKKCPVGCIEGDLRKPHFIEETKCVGCGICIDNCPKKAIYLIK